MYTYTCIGPGFGPLRLTASHSLPQGIVKALMLAQNRLWDTTSSRRLVVQLQNGWCHSLPCWCDLPEEFQEVDIVNKTTHHLGFA